MSARFRTYGFEGARKLRPAEADRKLPLIGEVSDFLLIITLLALDFAKRHENTVGDWRRVRRHVCNSR